MSDIERLTDESIRRFYQSIADQIAADTRSGSRRLRRLDNGPSGCATKWTVVACIAGRSIGRDSPKALACQAHQPASAPESSSAYRGFSARRDAPLPRLAP